MILKYFFKSHQEYRATDHFLWRHNGYNTLGSMPFYEGNEGKLYVQIYTDIYRAIYSTEITSAISITECHTFTEVVNQIELHNHVATQEKIRIANLRGDTVAEAHRAFHKVIDSCGNSIAEIKKFTTMLYSISGPELLDELTEEECKRGMEIMSRRQDAWLATELSMNDDPYLQTI